MKLKINNSQLIIQPKIDLLDLPTYEMDYIIVHCPTPVGIMQLIISSMSKIKAILPYIMYNENMFQHISFKKMIVSKNC